MSDRERRADEPVRVLHVVNDLGVGGVPSVVLSLVRDLDGERFDSSILVLSDDLSALAMIPAPGGVSVLTAPTPSPADHSVAGYFKDCFLLGRARDRGGAAIRRIRQLRPDILHFHTVAQDLAIGILAGRETGSSLVYTNHLLRLRSDDYSPLVRGLLRFALRRLFRRYHLIWVGRAVAEAGRASRFVGRGRLDTRIDNRVDTRRFRPPAVRPDSRRDGRVEIVYVARIHPVKGHDTLVRAYGAMTADVPVRLTLVGPDAMGGEIGRLVREHLGADRPIRILGSRSDVPDILRASHVGVFPSLREGRPLALLEMMATGLPVVVTDIPELLEVVRDGENGLVVPGGDAAALAGALDRLATDGPLRERLGDAARESVLPPPGSDPAREVGRFYDRVLEADGRGGAAGG